MKKKSVWLGHYDYLNMDLQKKKKKVKKIVQQSENKIMMIK